jgi:hypothetical protein
MHTWCRQHRTEPEQRDDEQDEQQLAPKVRRPERVDEGA